MMGKIMRNFFYKMLGTKARFKRSLVIFLAFFGSFFYLRFFFHLYEQAGSEWERILIGMLIGAPMCFLLRDWQYYKVNALADNTALENVVQILNVLEKPIKQAMDEGLIDREQFEQSAKKMLGDLKRWKEMGFYDDE